MVGKAHHCMVDGIAAVELGTLLLDPEPDAGAGEPDGWRAGAGAPRRSSSLARGVARPRARAARLAAPRR